MKEDDIREDKKEMSDAERAGLCATCRHSRRIASERDSIFYLCELSYSDPRFTKYPRLPVVQCLGYVQRRKT